MTAVMSQDMWCNGSALNMATSKAGLCLYQSDKNLKAAAERESNKSDEVEQKENSREYGTQKDEKWNEGKMFLVAAAVTTGPRCFCCSQAEWQSADGIW